MYVSSYCYIYVLRYVEPVNVLASLPTCIGLGCGQTINDVGQGIGRGAPV
jgi:hypothetical protein